MSVKVSFVVEDHSVFDNPKKFYATCEHVPRVGETVVRHIEAESSLDNRFTVVDVVTVIETREWYIEKNMVDPIVVVLEHVREKK